MSSLTHPAQALAGEPSSGNAIAGWNVMAHDGTLVVGHLTYEEAVKAAASINDLLRKQHGPAAMPPNVTLAADVDVALSRAVESEFCEWAMRQLGHATIFGFDHAMGDAFMVLLDSGRRVRGATLAQALLLSVECSVLNAPKPLCQRSFNESDSVS